MIQVLITSLNTKVHTLQGVLKSTDTRNEEQNKRQIVVLSGQNRIVWFAKLGILVFPNGTEL
jgi:hypothetical protein